MRVKFAYDVCFAFVLFSIDHYDRCKVISFLAVKTALARRHAGDRIQNSILFLFPEQTDVHPHAFIGTKLIKR